MEIAEASYNQKKIATVIATMACFMGPFLSSSVTVALPSMGREFQMGPILLGWINTALLLTMGSFMIPCGRLGDLYGRKKLFIGGMFFLLVASLLIALSHSGEMIIVYRALQGCASAMVTSTITPMLLSSVPQSERGQVLGIATASTYFGLSVGPFLGGIITHYLGWRFIFWFHIILCIPLPVMTHMMLKGDVPEARGESFDLIGAVVLGLGLFTIMYGVSHLPDISALLLIAIGIGIFAFFIFFEKRTAQPIVDINLFLHNPVFAFSNLAALINYAATFAVTFLLSLYLQKIKALTPQAAGFVLVAQPILMSAFSPMSGRLSDRVKPYWLASAGMAITFLGLLMSVALGADTSLWYVILCLMIHGVGFALFSSPNTNALMSSVDRQVYGVAAATLNTMRQTGMTFSMGIVTLVMSLMIGKADISPDNYDLFLRSMQYSFIIFGCLCFGGIFASLARGKH